MGINSDNLPAVAFSLETHLLVDIVNLAYKNIFEGIEHIETRKSPIEISLNITALLSSATSLNKLFSGSHENSDRGEESRMRAGSLINLLDIEVNTYPLLFTNKIRDIRNSLEHFDTRLDRIFQNFSGVGSYGIGFTIQSAGTDEIQNKMLFFYY